MSVAADIKAKSRIVQGMPVAELVARGEAEIGFQQIPEILPVKGMQYLGPLPDEIQSTTVFAAGIHAEARQAEAARAWVDYLKSPAAATTFEQHGMEAA